MTGPSANQIYSAVLAAVLNNSILVDFHSHDILYFTKPDTWRQADDMAQIRRLGSKVNVTVHENQHDISKSIEVRLVLESGTTVNIRYGTDPEKERARLLRHAARLVTKRAWAEQQQVLGTGGQGAVR